MSTGEGDGVRAVRSLRWDRATDAPDPLLTREWLVANGLGGYASGTVSGAPTRRYHGLLIAALPGPLGRMLMLGHLSDRLRLPDGRLVPLGGEEKVGGLLDLPGAGHLAEFRLEAAGSLKLRALDEKGRPVAEAVATIVSEGATEALAAAM